jgi:hypothetical protein
MIISYQKLTMDFVVDLLLIFACVLQAFHLAPPFWCSCVLWSELLCGVPSRLRTESVQLTGWTGRIWQPKHSPVQQVSSSVIWYHAKKRLSLDKVPLRPGEASWTHCAGAQVSEIIYCKSGSTFGMPPKNCMLAYACSLITNSYSTNNDQHA